MRSSSSAELDQAVAQFPLETYLTAHGGAVDTRHEWRVRCPRCGKDNLAVNVQKRRWRCFTCERYFLAFDPHDKKLAVGGGGVVGLIQWLDGLSLPGAVSVVKKMAAGAPSPVSSGYSAEIPDLAPPAHLAPVKQPTGLPRNALALGGILPYMQRRGISLSDAQLFGLRYVPADGTWLQNRLIFPVWKAGHCLYWQARACWDEHEHTPRHAQDKFRKSLNPPGERAGTVFLGKSDVLGNLELAANFGRGRVAVVEGPTSGIRTGPDAVWTFGKSLSPQQIALLVSAGVRAVDFCWDGPSPKEPYGAWPNMLAAARQLAPFVSEIRLVAFPRGDPGDYPQEQVSWFRSQGKLFDPNLL